MKRWYLTAGILATLIISSVALLAVPRAAAAGVPWSDSFAEYGMPASPQQWQPSNWDVQIHTRDNFTQGNDTHLADHGTDCSAPPAQHQVSSWQQAVFVCHNHVMTAIANGGYGEVTLTPDQMADWSQGPVTIAFSLSTQRTTSRDWFTVDVSPFAEQLSLPFSTGTVDLEGMPQHFIGLATDMDNLQTHWRLRTESSLEGDEFPYFESQTGIPMSAVTRTPFELTISQTGYSFRVAPSAPKGAGIVIFSGNWSHPISFTRGVVQFSHHSYDPIKCDVSALSCAPDTWHLSDIGITSAVPYTLLRPTDHQVVVGSSTVSFASGAPTGGFLKFMANGPTQVSYDGGATFHTPQRPPLESGAGTNYPSGWHNYMDPVPAGVSQAVVRNPIMARDFSIVSQSVQNGTPPPAPTNTPVPPTFTPQPTSTPTLAPSPTATPGGSVSLNNEPCVIVQNGALVKGTCTGTFTP